MSLEDASVGRHRIAWQELDHVARDQLGGVDDGVPAVAADAGPNRRGASQRGDRAMAASFGHGANGCVRAQHREDQGSLEQPTSSHRDHCSGAEQDGRRIHELPRDERRQRRLAQLMHLIAADG